MKKVLGLILSVMIILALLPTLPAKAADPFLLVVDTEIDLTKNGTYLDGKVEYDAATHTLTLNDLEPTQHKNVISAGSLGFVLTIKGSSKLTNEFDAAINVDGNLIIDGDFECYSGYQTPVTVNGNLIVNGGSLEVTRWSDGDAFNVGGDLTVNGGSLKAERPSGAGYALDVAGNLIVNGGSLEAKKSGNGNALKVGGDLTVNGGSLKAEQSGIGTSLGVTGNLIVNGGSLEAQKSGEAGYNLSIGNSLTLNNGERFVVGDENANEIRIAQAFLVRFVNDDEDQTELQSGYVEKDITPSYTGNTPTKEADAQYTYTFAGWDPEITAVTGDATYTATYTKTVNKYDLTFDLNGGTLDGKTGIITMTYEYGYEINLPDAPTKEGYTFKYWRGSTHAAGEKYTVTEKHDFTAEWGETIDSVSLTVTPPLCGTSVFGNSWSDFYVGDTRQTPQPEVSIPSGEGYELDEDEYTNYGIWLTSDYYWVKGTIIGGKTYIAEISLRPTEDFAFADEMSISVSGGTLKNYAIYWNDDGQDLMIFVEVEALHDWGEWTVTKEPTTTEEGVETRVCKYDPTHTETRPIPKLPADNPKTGDNGNAGLWAAIMGGALLVVIAAIVADRKYLKKQR